MSTADSPRESRLSRAVVQWTGWRSRSVRLAKQPSSSWAVSFALHFGAIIALGLIMLPVGRVMHHLGWIEATVASIEHAVIEESAIVVESPGAEGLTANSVAADGVLAVGVEMAAEVADRGSESPLPQMSVLSQAVPEQANRERAEHQADPSAPGSEVPAAAPQTDALAQAQVRGFYDHIVQQFILYDIGQLTGAAGRQARSAFEALGTDAIPSVIDGFNRSASIQASCPVVVLRSKLRSLLASSNDASMIELAIAELGRGVPNTAPHAAIILQFQQELAQFRDSALAAEAAELVRQLSRANRDSVRSALQSADPKVRWAATRVVAERGLRLLDDLLPMLDDPHPDVQQEARFALVRLARGQDFGPLRTDTPEQHAEAVAKWREWAQGFRPSADDEEDAHMPRDPVQASEARAESYLKMAQRLEARGLVEQAQKRYRALIDDFPQTAAADEARRRLATP